MNGENGENGENGGWSERKKQGLNNKSPGKFTFPSIIAMPVVFRVLSVPSVMSVPSVKARKTVNPGLCFRISHARRPSGACGFNLFALLRSASR